MKEETRKRKDKIKRQLADIERQVKSENGDKKMSTSEKNKKILDLLVKKDEDEIEEPEEKTTEKKEKMRYFECITCGITVELDGEAEPIVEGKCSKCSE